MWSCDIYMHGRGERNEHSLFVRLRRRGGGGFVFATTDRKFGFGDGFGVFEYRGKGKYECMLRLFVYCDKIKTCDELEGRVSQNPQDRTKSLILHLLETLLFPRCRCISKGKR